MATNYGLSSCKGLLFYHSFSGCDYTPSFFGIGKVRFWDLLFSDSDKYRDVFNSLSTAPTEVTDEQMEVLEHYVLSAYRSTADSLNLAWLDCITHLYTEKFRSLPPSKGALLQHVKRCAFIAGHVWGGSDEARPTLPSYSDWGWMVVDSDNIVPIWTENTSDTAYATLQAKCGCRAKDPCSRRSCKCWGRKCLSYCKCRGQCRKTQILMI